MTCESLRAMLADSDFAEFIDTFIDLARICGFGGEDEVIAAFTLPMFDAFNLEVDDETRAKAEKIYRAIGYQYEPYPR